MADTAQARAEAALRRDAALEAVAFAAQRFLETSEWESIVPQALRRLGDATGVSRVYLSENRPGADGDVLTTVRFEWTSPGVRGTLGERAVTGASYEGDGFARWIEILGRGDVLHGVVREFPESERRELESQDVRSILFVPIFVDQEWWGGIGFDDCLEERVWTQVEIDALRAAAGTIGAAISRRRAEDLLREAEARFRAIVERTPAITYQEVVSRTGDPDASVVYVSPQVERILGYPAEKWWQVPGFWIQIMHPDDAERVAAEGARVRRSGEPYNQDYRMVAADGRIVWFHDESILLRDTSGRADVWQGVMLDVTEQKRSEERLREAEAKYRALVEHIPAVTYRQTPDGDPEQFYVSPQVQDLFGHSVEDWTWTPNFWIDHIHPDDRERVAEADLETDRTGEPVDLEYRLRRADGEHVWVHDQATFVRQEGGLGFWQGFMMDISERKRAEEALREAEAEYRTLVERLPALTYREGIVASEQELFLSPQVRAMFGYTEDEWRNTRNFWFDHLHPDDLERVGRANERANHTGEPFVVEYRFRRADGTYVWVLDQASRIEEEDGRGFWQGFIQDVTERKHAEERLEQALLVEREASERLRALDDMKNTFLQAVSHDLRTPLAAILGLAVTLERADLELETGDAKDMARRIAVNARKLDRMVSDLLDLDRLARGIVEPKRHATDVGALVRRVVNESDLAAQGRVEVEAPALVVNVDPAKVERIVENLLANALRHTPKDTDVWVRVEPTGTGVLLVVEDDGPGVAEEDRAVIFEPFRQGPDAPEHSPGVGVGLTLVARFAELLGGRAWVQDREGGGASFRVFVADEPSATVRAGAAG